MDSKSNRNLIIAVAILLILCCCCSFLASGWFVWGDPLARALGIQF
jgi:hypothetical protein